MRRLDGDVDPESETQVAEALALELFAGRLTADASADVVEHTRRVAAAVQPEAKAVAWLHDTVEDGVITLGRIACHGFSALTVAGVALLTRYNHDGAYADRIATLAVLPGDLGRIVRAVKLCDLADNLSRPRINDYRRERWEAAQLALRTAVAEHGETDPTA